MSRSKQAPPEQVPSEYTLDIPGVNYGRPLPPASTWVDPLPPSLRSRVDPELGERFAELGRQATLDERRATTLRRKIEAARLADAIALEAAVEAFEPEPPAKAPALEQELAELERRLTVYPGALYRSAEEILASIAPSDLAEVLAEVRARARDHLEAMPRQVEALNASIEHVGALGGEEQWLTRLATSGNAQPYHPISNLSRAMYRANDGVLELRRALELELERTVEWAVGKAAAAEQPTGYVTTSDLTLNDPRALTPRRGKAAADQAEGGESSS